MRVDGVLFLAAITGALATASAGAAEIYHWIDEHGVAHYSQWKPESGPSQVNLVMLEENATAGVGGDIYPVHELAEAIAELRAERAEERKDRQSRARRDLSPTVAYPAEPVVHATWPYWGPGGPLYPHPPQRPKPTPDPPADSEPEPESFPYRPPGTRR